MVLSRGFFSVGGKEIVSPTFSHSQMGGIKLTAEVNEVFQQVSQL